MEDVRIITNVGIKKGYSGDGIIWIGKTAGGTYLATVQHKVGEVTTWRYYRRSMIEAGYQSGDVLLSNDVNIALLTDTVEPGFVTPGSDPFLVIPSVTNGADLPRLYELQPAYTLKGDGVTATEIDKIKAAGGTSGLKTDGTTDTTGTTDSTTSKGLLDGFFPKDFGLLFSNPIQFLQDNALFVGAVAGLIYYMRRKKKKPLWIF